MDGWMDSQGMLSHSAIHAVSAHSSWRCGVGGGCMWWRNEDENKLKNDGMIEYGNLGAWMHGLND